MSRKYYEPDDLEDVDNGLNLGSVIVSVASSHTTSTGISQYTASGGQPTTLVNRCGPSSIATTATTYGKSGVKAGWKAVW